MINDKKIKLILFDVDNTLIYGDAARKFYGQYSIQLEMTLAKYLGIDLSEAKTIANSFRKQFDGRGEKSFDSLNIGIDVWYEEIFSINPEKYLEPMNKTNDLLVGLKQRGFMLGAITDGPTEQSRRIMKVAGVKYETLDFIIGWEKGKAMPKNGSGNIFREMCAKYDLEPGQILMIGDCMQADILPADEVGLETIFIRGNGERPERFKSVKNIEELI